MTLESASPSCWQSIVGILLLIAVFTTICHVSPDYKPHVVRLHEALTSFTTRGQTTVELFAPLSTILGSSPDGRLFLTVASHISWLLVGAIFFEDAASTQNFTGEQPFGTDGTACFVGWYSMGF
jgi:hypothetical protein